MSQTLTIDSHELQAIPVANVVSQEVSDAAMNAEEPPDTASQSLPPIDGGKAAWSLLLAAFVFEALLWGS